MTKLYLGIGNMDVRGKVTQISFMEAESSSDTPDPHNSGVFYVINGRVNAGRTNACPPGAPTWPTRADIPRHLLHRVDHFEGLLRIPGNTEKVMPPAGTPGGILFASANLELTLADIAKEFAAEQDPDQQMTLSNIARVVGVFFHRLTTLEKNEKMHEILDGVVKTCMTVASKNAT